MFIKTWKQFPSVRFITYNVISSKPDTSHTGARVSGYCILSDQDFHSITLASPTTDYKGERMNEYESEMEMWVNEGTMNEQVMNKIYIYITCEYWVNELMNAPK